MVLGLNIGEDPAVPTSNGDVLARRSVWAALANMGFSCSGGCFFTGREVSLGVTVGSRDPHTTSLPLPITCKFELSYSFYVSYARAKSNGGTREGDPSS